MDSKREFQNAIIEFLQAYPLLCGSFFLIASALLLLVGLHKARAGGSWFNEIKTFALSIIMLVVGIIIMTSNLPSWLIRPE